MTSEESHAQVSLLVETDFGCLSEKNDELGMMSDEFNISDIHNL